MIYTEVKICTFATFVHKKFEDKYTSHKKYHRVREHCHYTGKMCILKYVFRMCIPVNVI